MKRSGRASLLVILGVVCLVLLIPLMCVSTRGPANTAADFMTALGQHDVAKLVELSSIGSADEAKRKKLWEQTIERSRHFLFTWRITNSTQNTPKDAVATVMMRRNLQLKMGSSEEKFELPLIKKDNQWKVDVQSMNRAMFPALPRA